MTLYAVIARRSRGNLPLCSLHKGRSPRRFAPRDDVLSIEAQQMYPVASRNFLSEWCRCVADMKKPPMGSTMTYVPLVVLIEAAQM